ncbi:C2 family cysteine protease [Nocardia brasiliensis]|uniref:C2 family cysteine protease n=1 Tax=Nocardia brasiliensis TaxID=37326 RepID=UPI0024538D79|nr:C2 family cysteine protease [Nocardia brasiliensis]
MVIHAYPQRRSSVAALGEHQRRRERESTWKALRLPGRITSVELTDFPLWGPGSELPVITDVKQGRVGSCWLLAVLAAAAHTVPDYLKSLVTHGAGGYTVGFDTPITVGPAIDCIRYPFRGDPQRLYASFKHAAWVAVIEKAMARRGTLRDKDSYDALNGGHAHTVMDALGLGPAEVYDVDPTDTTVIDLIDTALKEKRLVTARLDAHNPHEYAIVDHGPHGLIMYNPHGHFTQRSRESFLHTAESVTISGPIGPRRHLSDTLPHDSKSSIDNWTNINLACYASTTSEAVEKLRRYTSRINDTLNYLTRHGHALTSENLQAWLPYQIYRLITTFQEQDFGRDITTLQWCQMATSH